MIRIFLQTWFQNQRARRKKARTPSPIRFDPNLFGIQKTPSPPRAPLAPLCSQNPYMCNLPETPSPIRPSVYHPLTFNIPSPMLRFPETPSPCRPHIPPYNPQFLSPAPFPVIPGLYGSYSGMGLYPGYQPHVMFPPIFRYPATSEISTLSASGNITESADNANERNKQQ